MYHRLSLAIGPIGKEIVRTGRLLTRCDLLPRRLDLHVGPPGRGDVDLPLRQVELHRRNE